MSDIKLTNKQTIAHQLLLDNKTNEILFGGAAGSGKSMLGCLWILTSALKYPRTRWLIGRSVLKTLKTTTLKTFFEIALLFNLKKDEHYKYDGSKDVFTLLNGSEIMLKDLQDQPSDPNFDSLGSLELTGAFIDECNQISEKAKSIIFSRIRYKLDENDLIPKIFMTCNPAKNWVYNSFYKPYRENSLQLDRKFIQALVTDNPYISKHYIDSLNKLDQVSKQRLLYGNWDYESDDYLIPFENLYNLFQGNQQYTQVTHLSIDVARFGKDSTTIIMWNNMSIIDFKHYNKQSISDSYFKIKEIIDKYNIKMENIIIDSDGVGGGLVDMLGGCISFINNSRALNNENYQNLKTQCYYKLIEKVNNGGINIFNYTDEIKLKIEQELQILKRRNLERDGKLQIISKDEIKKLIGRSPDFSDAIAFKMFYELKPDYQDFDYEFDSF